MCITWIRAVVHQIKVVVIELPKDSIALILNCSKVMFAKWIIAPIEALDSESIKLCLYENNFTELFDNLGVLGEYQLKYTNLLGTASDLVAKRRAKKYGDKIAVPDEDVTASYRDWEYKEMKSMSNRKGRKRLKNVEIKI